MGDFEGRNPGESLESFIDRVVNPDSKYIAQTKTAIHKVAELMKSKSVDHKIATTVKGGSLGKGTAVKGRSDADLLFVYGDIKSIETLKAELQKLLRELQSALDRSEYKVTAIKKTPFTIQFELQIDGTWNEVDVLPIIGLPVDLSNPSKAALGPIYQQMKANEDLREYYFKCLAPLQVSFVSQRDEKLKRSIRLLKFWIKTRKHVLKSYAAELLVIKAYEEIGSPAAGKLKTLELMTKVFQKLSDIRTLTVSWDTYYSPASYYLPSPPYILDPAFPYHNLTRQKSGGLDEKYVHLERDAKKFLANLNGSTQDRCSVTESLAKLSIGPSSLSSSSGDRVSDSLKVVANGSLTVFEGRQPKESLESFIDRVVNPDPKYTTQMKAAIHSVAELMKSKSVDHKIGTILKGGSLGKGTAVKGRSDADLSLAYVDIKSVLDLSVKLPDLLRELQSALEKSEYKITSVKRTKFTIQFEIIVDGIVNEVDLLPIVSLPVDLNNPSKAALDPIYKQMKENEGIRDYYCKCLAPLQVNFVSKRTDKVKRSIRLLKYWIKTQKHVLKSYAAELLVIKAYEELGSPEPGKMKTADLMTKVFVKLSNLKSLAVSWDTYYSPSAYKLPSPPYILDPAFPYHNLIEQKSARLDEQYVALERDAKKVLPSMKL